MRAQNTMLVALIAASCLLLGQARSTNAQTADKNAASATIQELKEEWVKTLRRAVEVLELQYRGGVVDFARVGKAQSALTEALIEVASSREERIELLQQHCELLEGTVLFAKTKVEHGQANEVDFLEARAVLLRAKIRLLQAQAEPEAQTSNKGSSERADTNAPQVSRSPDLETNGVEYPGRSPRLSRWRWNRRAP